MALFPLPLLAVKMAQHTHCCQPRLRCVVLALFYLASVSRITNGFNNRPSFLLYRNPFLHNCKSVNNRLMVADYIPRKGQLFGSNSNVEGMIQSIKEMRAAAIKKELTALGVGCADVVEKEELVRRLVEKRLALGTASTEEPKVSTSSTPDPPSGAPADATVEVEVEIRAAVEEMRAAAIKRELVSLGVGVEGVVDKDELVRRLVEKRVALAAPGGRAGAGGATVPIHRMGTSGPKDYICCTVTIAGRPEQFLIDTGASNCVVTEAVKSRYGLMPVRATTTTGSGGGGGIFNTEVVQLPSAEVGGWPATLQALVLPTARLPPGVAGLLGVDFLRNFRVADFDLAAGELRLHDSAERLQAALEDERRRGGGGGGGEGLAAVGLIPGHPLGFAAAAVEVTGPGGGRCQLPALVDMGSTYSLVNSAAAAVAGVGPGNTGWQPNHAQVLGVDGRPMSLALGPFASVRLLGPPGDPNGGIDLGPMPLHVGDMPGLQNAGFAPGPTGIIGLDILGRRRCLLDFAEDRAYLLRSR